MLALTWQALLRGLVQCGSYAGSWFGLHNVRVLNPMSVHMTVGSGLVPGSSATRQGPMQGPLLTFVYVMFKFMLPFLNYVFCLRRRPF